MYIGLMYICVCIMYDALVANVCFMIHRHLWLETEGSNRTTGIRAADPLQAIVFPREREISAGDGGVESL